MVRGVILETMLLGVLEATVTVTVAAGTLVEIQAGKVFAETAIELRRVIRVIDRLVAMMD